MSRLYLGIDPGVSGGLAALNVDGSVAYLAKFDGMTERDVLDALRGLAGDAHAVLELVHAMPKNGSVSAFKMGHSYGGLRMALLAAGVPFDVVSPVKWQTAMSCRTGGQKNVSKARAQALFPAVRVTMWNADALLLAEYGRRQGRETA